jgi:hypothetical protein
MSQSVKHIVDADAWKKAKIKVEDRISDAMAKRVLNHLYRDDNPHIAASIQMHFDPEGTFL